MSLQQLSNILSLPAEDLQQVLSYAETLSRQEAADHFTNLLGASPQSIEFISSFNSKRQDPSSSSKAPAAPESYASVPKPKPRGARKKAPLHTPAPRQVNDTYSAPGTAYKKKGEDDYVVKKPATPKPAANSSNNAFTLDSKPAAIRVSTARPPHSAAGTLISDTLSKPTKNSRTSSPAPKAPPKTKVNITGGISMHGASTALSELDSAIRALEISTNSTIQDNKKRACNCIATRHPLLTAAPNCLNCGKVICVKEGLGPCTFCGSPLLSAVEVQSMISSLREERGREKMALDNAGNRRAEVSKKPLPFTQPRNPDMSPAELKAKEHRDRLLGFQEQNAKRTTVRDEAADFDVDVGKGQLWMSPIERAKEVKRLQKVMGEREWNARPEYEKRRQVVSLDLVGGRIKKTVKMAAVERPDFTPASDSEPEEEVGPLRESSGNGGGTFSRNPLLAGLIKPVWKPQVEEGKGKGIDSGGGENDGEQGRKKMWRRVQDDLDDNEAIILDGGALGGVGTDRDREEPDCG